MGSLSAKLSQCKKEKDVRIVILGLYNSGKTSILRFTQLGDVVKTTPTMDFDVETIVCKKLSLTVFDVGGRNKVRPLLRHFYSNTDAVIFVVDSDDQDMLTDAKKELMKCISEPELQNVPLAIALNKWDLPNHLSFAEMRDRMGVYEIGRSRPCGIFLTSAISDNGMELFDMLDWICDKVKESRKRYEAQSPNHKETFMKEAVAKLKDIFLD
jgi:small GTP-binding protein